MPRRRRSASIRPRSPARSTARRSRAGFRISSSASASRPSPPQLATRGGEAPPTELAGLDQLHEERVQLVVLDVVLVAETGLALRTKRPVQLDSLPHDRAPLAR